MPCLALIPIVHFSSGSPQKESMVGYQVFKYCIEGVDSTSWDAVHWKIHKDEDLEDLYDKKVREKCDRSSN